MSRLILLVAMVLSILVCGMGSADAYSYTADGTGSFSATQAKHISDPYPCGNIADGGSIVYYNDGAAKVYVKMHHYVHCQNCGGVHFMVNGVSGVGGCTLAGESDTRETFIYSGYTHSYESWQCGGADDLVTDLTITISEIPFEYYTASGNTSCITLTQLYEKTGAGGWAFQDESTGDTYTFEICNNSEYRLLFDGVYYDFTCDGDEVFDYDACIYVYGYTCGVDTIKLRDDESQLIDTVYQSSGYDLYEMLIDDGEEYTISFYDMGILLCYNQTFTCTGDHVLIDFDRCNYLYRPGFLYGDYPYIIYLWAGYDYNIVVFRDEHGNFVENSQLAIYDKTDSQYIQRWTDASDGYTLLGARFDTDHDVLLSLRTFDGIFTLDTTYPANGSALVGEEDITTTNWTIPIRYNVDIFPADVGGMPILDVFCGLSEYTPLNPGAFWGMDLSDQGVIPVSSCSGFAMCDIMAEKAGYANYTTTALNWTSKSALVKDYRHNIIMEEE